ncbi:MAG: C25 family cysteine peptidase [Anaerolineae bacterium]|nr:C25 family cysteine peptidase [Anaerolineae bacterium]
MSIRLVVTVSLVAACLGVVLTASSDCAAAATLRDAHAPVYEVSQGKPHATMGSDTLILASLDDSYYGLAQEIAEVEGSTVVHTWADALAGETEFVLWVVSPEGMSDHDLVGLGLVRKERETAVSLGIITGSSMEVARQLWLRGGQAEGRLVVAANAANPSGNLRSGMLVFGPGGIAIRSLTLANVQRYLQRADYFTFTGHGGPRYLRLDEITVFRADQIPALSPIVVATASCNTVRIWEEDSIALAFVDQGAAAYAGFAYSPNEGYLVGEFYGAPFRYTWPGFPIGHVVEIQNKGAVKGFAQFPYYYLLGDPRIALQDEAPYRLLEDKEEAGARRLRYEGAPEGFIPLRISDGARYRFVEIPGVTSSWELDPFYNSRLQMVDFGDDKYLLFEHAGGAFEVLLRERPPWYWPAMDFLVDSLDHTLVYLLQTGGDVIALFTGAVAWLALLRLLRRTRRVRVYLLASVLTAALVACLQGAYALVRLGEVTVTSKMVAFSPLAVLGMFLVTAAAALVFLASRHWAPRIAALVMATAPTWASMAFSLALVGLVNNLTFRPKLGAGIYNYSLAVLPLGTLLVQVCVMLVCFSVAKVVVERLQLRQEAPVGSAA